MLQQPGTTRDAQSARRLSLAHGSKHVERTSPPIASSNATAAAMAMGSVARRSVGRAPTPKTPQAAADDASVISGGDNKKKAVPAVSDARVSIDLVDNMSGQLTRTMETLAGMQQADAQTRGQALLLDDAEVFQEKQIAALVLELNDWRRRNADMKRHMRRDKLVSIAFVNARLHDEVEALRALRGYLHEHEVALTEFRAERFVLAQQALLHDPTLRQAGSPVAALFQVAPSGAHHSTHSRRAARRQQQQQRRRQSVTGGSDSALVSRSSMVPPASSAAGTASFPGSPESASPRITSAANLLTVPGSSFGRGGGSPAVAAVSPATAAPASFPSSESSSPRLLAVSHSTHKVSSLPPLDGGAACSTAATNAPQLLHAAAGLSSGQQLLRRSFPSTALVLTGANDPDTFAAAAVTPSPTTVLDPPPRRGGGSSDGGGDASGDEYDSSRSRSQSPFVGAISAQPQSTTFRNLKAAAAAQQQQQQQQRRQVNNGSSAAVGDGGSLSHLPVERESTPSAVAKRVEAISQSSIFRALLLAEDTPQSPKRRSRNTKTQGPVTTAAQQPPLAAATLAAPPVGTPSPRQQQQQRHPSSTLKDRTATAILDRRKANDKSNDQHHDGGLRAGKKEKEGGSFLPALTRRGGAKAGGLAEAPGVMLPTLKTSNTKPSSEFSVPPPELPAVLNTASDASVRKQAAIRQRVDQFLALKAPPSDTKSGGRLQPEKNDAAASSPPALLLADSGIRELRRLLRLADETQRQRQRQQPASSLTPQPHGTMGLPRSGVVTSSMRRQQQRGGCSVGNDNDDVSYRQTAQLSFALTHASSASSTLRAGTTTSHRQPSPPRRAASSLL